MSSGPYHANHPAPPRALYLAGPYSEKDRVSALAVALRAASIPVVSTWHDIPTPVNPTKEQLADCSRVNHRDLRRADAAVFVTHRGEGLETWVEFGACFERILCLVIAAAQTRLPISVERTEYVEIQHITPAALHVGELAWLVKRIGAWYGAL